MKQILFYASLFLISLTSCQTSKKEITVNGKFVGDTPSEIIYSIPINGICYEWFSSSSDIDSSGNFKLKIEAEGPCFITFFTKGKRGQLIAEPGETYNITIESSNGDNSFEYDCQNALLQREYQKFYSPPHPQMLIMKLIDSPIYVAKSKIDSMYSKEVADIERLSGDKTLSPELLDLIKFDREMFYATAQQQLAAIKHFYAKRQDPEAVTDSITNFWNDAISNTPFDSDKFLKSKWAFYSAQLYLNYKDYSASFNSDILSKAREEGKIHTYRLNIAKKYLDKGLLEFYSAAYILTSAQQKIFEKELIGLFDEFLTDFPNSKYIPYLKPPIEKIIDFHKKAGQGLDKDIKFIDGYKNINSLDECFQSFKGEKVYVDIWATWCGACKDEFKHSKELKQLLASRGVSMLYISIDREKDEKRWEGMIKYYQLSGSHIRATPELKADLKNMLGRFGIPRYLLVDENGKVINKNAKRPSKLSELEKQLIGF